jgi:hypothetical protein
VYVFAASNEGYLSTSLYTGISTFYGLTDRNSILSVLACSPYDGTKHETFNGPAYFSNLAMFTEDISLIAPGWDIYSTKAWSLDAAQTLYMSGTSMATPAVCGVLGLVQQAYPYMSAKQLADVVLSTTSAYPVDTSRPTYTIMSSSNVFGKVLDYGINIICYVPTVRPTTQAGWKALIKQVTGWDEELYTKLVTDNQLCDQDGNLNLKRIYFYDNVPMSVVFGQGLVNADLATNGLGTLNAKRLTSSDLDTTYASAANGSQALYKVDTAGYDSVSGRMAMALPPHSVSIIPSAMTGVWANSSAMGTMPLQL